MPITIAHRGYSGKYPENSAKAFTEAIKMGVNMIEIDLRLSKDDIWLVHHDPSLIRTFQQEKWISEIYVKDRPNDLLTFKETLDLINGRTLLYLDIKDHPTESDLLQLFIMILDEVKDRRTKWKLEHFYLASFHFPIVTSLLYLREKIGPFPIKIGFIGELLPQMLLSWVDPCINLRGINFVSTYLDVVTSKYLEIAKSKNLQVFVYTLNTKFTLQHYVNLGVDGLLSDQVELFQELEPASFPQSIKKPTKKFIKKSTTKLISKLNKKLNRKSKEHGKKTIQT